MSGIRTHPANDAYRENWDRMFGKKADSSEKIMRACAVCQCCHLTDQTDYAKRYVCDECLKTREP